MQTETVMATYGDQSKFNTHRRAARPEPCGAGGHLLAQTIERKPNSLLIWTVMMPRFLLLVTLAFLAACGSSTQVLMPTASPTLRVRPLVSSIEVRDVSLPRYPPATRSSC